ncbi:MAG: hydroxyisourate hydrolase [Gammaproteobacteria bacterium]|jgi:hydroxyisourate hydrolase
MGHLSTHVLDTVQGKPAAGIRIELFSLGKERVQVKSIITNADGRCDEPMLADEEMQRGEWELVFHIGEYFRAHKVESTGVPFLNQVPVRFGIDDPDKHYHVPLLASPWSYTTYRGS